MLTCLASSPRGLVAQWPCRVCVKRGSGAIIKGCLSGVRHLDVFQSCCHDGMGHCLQSTRLALIFMPCLLLCGHLASLCACLGRCCHVCKRDVQASKAAQGKAPRPSLLGNRHDVDLVCAHCRCAWLCSMPRWPQGSCGFNGKAPLVCSASCAAIVCLQGCAIVVLQSGL